MIWMNKKNLCKVKTKAYNMKENNNNNNWYDKLKKNLSRKKKQFKKKSIGEIFN